MCGVSIVWFVCVYYVWCGMCLWGMVCMCGVVCLFVWGYGVYVLCCMVWGYSVYRGEVCVCGMVWVSGEVCSACVVFGVCVISGICVNYVYVCVVVCLYVQYMQCVCVWWVWCGGICECGMWVCLCVYCFWHGSSTEHCALAWLCGAEPGGYTLLLTSSMEWGWPHLPRCVFP